MQIGDEFIPADTTIWAAGVKPRPLSDGLGGSRGRMGRVEAAHDLSLPEHPNVFVIGDMAAAKDKHGNQLPGVAPVAMQQGKHVAKLITASLNGNNESMRQPSRYFDKRQMATIGRRRAIVEMGKLRLTGTNAWLVWLFVRILFPNGMRSHLFVLLSWVRSYLLYSRGARLIVPSQYRNEKSNRTAEPLRFS